MEWLRYWSVLSVCLFLEQFPFTGHFLSVIPVWPEIRLAFALWLQLPVTRGCDWAFSGVVPLLDRYVKKIPALQLAQNQMGAATVEQRGIVVSILSSVGLVSKKTGKKLMKATEMNGTLIMVAIPFMLSPSFITKIGVLVVGLAFPAHASTTAVLELEHFKKDLKKHDGDETDDAAANHAGADAGEQSVFWLEYWVVYVIFSLVHAPLATVFGWWFPLWDQFHLAILLWMQISYFSGAHNVFKVAVVIGRVWRRRRRAAMRRRRSASSVPGVQEKIENIVGSIPLLSPLLVAATSPGPDDRSSEGGKNSDDDEYTDDETRHQVRDEDSVKLKDAGDIIATKDQDELAKERRQSSRAVSDGTITNELMNEQVDDQSEPNTLGDDFVAVETEGPTD
jgi:hypothetical protein